MVYQNLPSIYRLAFPTLAKCTIDVYFASKIVLYCFTNIVTAIKEFCFKEKKLTYSPPTVETHFVEEPFLFNKYLLNWQHWLWSGSAWALQLQRMGSSSCSGFREPQTPALGRPSSFWPLDQQGVLVEPL